MLNSHLLNILHSYYNCLKDYASYKDYLKMKFNKLQHNSEN